MAGLELYFRNQECSYYKYLNKKNTYFLSLQLYFQGLTN